MFEKKKYLKSGEERRVVFMCGGERCCVHVCFSCSQTDVNGVNHQAKSIIALSSQTEVNQIPFRAQDEPVCLVFLFFFKKKKSL